MAPIEVIVNASGGNFVAGKTDEELRSAFDEQGVDINLRLPTGGEIDAAARAAARSDADIIVGCGGDGTLNTVAASAVPAGKTLGVIPFGTFNHFSKDLGIPQDILGAVAVISAGKTRFIDVGEVNGRTFINNSSIGLYPRMVRKRLELQQRLGRSKWSAAFLAALSTLRRDALFRVEIELDGKIFTRKTPFVFVGNNEYAIELYKIGGRDRLDDGKLSVYIPRHGGRTGVWRIVLRTILGLLRPDREFESICIDKLTINVRRPRVTVAFDGEIETMETPLRYCIKPGALSVLAPKEDG